MTVNRVANLIGQRCRTEIDYVIGGATFNGRLPSNIYRITQHIIADTDKTADLTASGVVIEAEFNRSGLRLRLTEQEAKAAKPVATVALGKAQLNGTREIKGGFSGKYAVRLRCNKQTDNGGICQIS